MQRHYSGEGPLEAKSPQPKLLKAPQIFWKLYKVNDFGGGGAK